MKAAHKGEEAAVKLLLSWDLDPMVNDKVRWWRFIILSFEIDLALLLLT